MKNLKKVLSLVLVLVMACGLFATAGAVEYVDEADINYAEAVDVMSGIGILEGVGGDKFSPKSPVTRAAAAKIIAYLMLGKDSADALVKSATQFTDVPAGHWAAGYVQFCANEGIINGKSATVFAPDEGVTTIGFAKLLLGALGYGTKDEFVGTGWEKNVTKYAAQAKIFAGNYAANPDAVATREEAALYAFNALKADKVVYSTLFGDYLTNAGILADGEGYGSFAADYYLPEEPATGVVTYTNGVYTVAGVVVAAKQEDIGRFASVWYQEKVENVKIAITEPVILGKTVATKYNTIVDEATWANYNYGLNPNYVALADTTVTYYVDGVAQNTTITAPNKGDKIEFVDNNGNGKVDTVLVTTYAATNIAAPVAVNPVTKAVTINGTTYADGTVVYPELAVGDVVYYNTNAATGVTTYTKAVVAAGQKTAYTAAAGIMIFGGAPYTVTGIPSTISIQDATSDLSAIPFNSDYALYLDAAGNVITAVSTAAIDAPNYVILLDSVKVAGTGLSATAYVEAQVLKLDGTTEIVKVAQVGATTAANYNQTQADTTNEGVWYNLTKNQYGQDVLELVTGVVTGTTQTITTGNVAIGAGNPFVTKAVANNATVFVVKSGSAPFFAYNVYTGYAAVPTSNDADIEVINNPLTGIAAYVYADVTGDTDFGQTVGNYALVSSLVPTTYQTGTVKYDAYKAVIAGQADALNIKWTGNSAPALGAGTVGIYAVTYDAAGYATLSAAAANITNYGAVAVTAAAGVATVDGNALAYNANSKAYVVNAFTGAVTATTVEAAALTQNIAAVSVVKGIGSAAAANTIVELYIVA